MEYADIYAPLITLATAQITILDLAKLRFRGKKLGLIVGLMLIILSVVNALIIFLGGLELYTRFYFLTMDVPSFCIFWYTAKRRDFRDVFTLLVTLFINFSNSMIAMWLVRIFELNHIWYDLVRLMVFITSIIFIHNVIRKPYLQLQEEINKGWGFFSLLPIFTCGYVYYKFWQYGVTGDFFASLVDCTVTVFIMAAMFLVFYYIFQQLHEKYIFEEQKRILSVQNKAQREQFEQQKEAAEKTNRRWHDLRHHTQQLIELLEEGKIEVALNYLKEQTAAETIPKEEYCLHTAVNSILRLWAERSRMTGIQVSIQTDIPDNLEIDPMELSALCANAFENAYEGCSRLEGEIPKFIKVEAQYNGRRLAIGFQNSCQKDIKFEDGLPVSSKPGGGIGTRSIIYTVNRFRGSTYFKAEEGVFTARFILNI